MTSPPAAEATPAPPPDSAALARGIAAGDEAAFAAFYSAWFAATLALARASSRRDESFCLDVVQDVMLAVCRKLPALRDERAVRAWIATAVWNAAADRGRAERARARREQGAAARDEVDPAEPWQGLAAGERQQWLATRLQELPEVDRALLAARFGDSESVAAAGAAFGMTPDGAHGRLRRVLQRLRNAATEWWHGS